MKSRSLYFALLVITTCPLSAAAQDTKLAPAAVSKQDAQKIQRWIVEGEQAKAVKWLDANFEGEQWCWAVARIQGLRPVQMEQLRADLGVLARRAKRDEQAMRCLSFSLDRPGSEHRAAAFYEAYLVLPRLNEAARKPWVEEWKGEGMQYGDYWKYADNCILDARGPIKPRIACALSRASASKWSRAKLREELHPLLFHAARLAPKTAYFEKLSAQQKQKALRYAKAPALSVEKRASFDTASQLEEQMRARFSTREQPWTEPPVIKLKPCSDFPEDTEREDLPAKGCYEFGVSEGDVAQVAAGSVQLVTAIGGTIQRNQFNPSSASYGCNNRSRPYLRFITGDRQATLDLGVESGGDNCYVNASGISHSLTLSDAKLGRVFVSVNTYDASVTSHMDPRPVHQTQRDFVCQVGAEQAPIVCIASTRASYLYSEQLYSAAPEVIAANGKIALKKRPGDYYHPEYDVLIGLAPLDAAKALPGIQKRIEARIDKAASPAKKTPAHD